LLIPNLQTMKTLNLIVITALLFLISPSFAQSTVAEKGTLSIDKNTNCYIRYYYFPNMEAYYDILKKEYHFKSNSDWETASELPTNYGGYSLYKNVKVIINDFDDENPAQHIKTHKKMYPYTAKGRMKKLTELED
jgi:hypothetical protein